MGRQPKICSEEDFLISDTSMCLDALCISTIIGTTWKSLMKRLMMDSSLVTLQWPKHAGTEGDAINFNEKRSFLDDKFLEPKSEVTQCPSNIEYFPYIPAYENTTPTKSPILQDFISPEDPPECTEADDHPTLNELDQPESVDHLESSKTQDNVIIDLINWSKEKHIELVNIIGEPLAGITTRSRKLIEALGKEGWIIAMQEELNQFERNKVWTLVPKPHGKTIIGTKWIWNNKMDEKGLLEAIRIVLAYAAYMGFMVYQMDVKNAFLNEKISKEVYVQQPLRFESSEFPNHVYKLDKALYGLKQAPEAWKWISTTKRPKTKAKMTKPEHGNGKDGAKSRQASDRFNGDKNAESYYHDISLTKFYIPKVSKILGISPTISQFYKPIEDNNIHEVRVVDQVYYKSNNIEPLFTNIRFNCLFQINEPIVSRFILDFYSQVTVQTDEYGYFIISFMIQHEFITFTLAQFGQILKIPYNGQAVFTNEWDLAYLEYSQETKGPYCTNLPTPDDIRRLLELERVVVDRTIKSQTVSLNLNQILTKEPSPDIKQWEELIRENMFGVGGHRDRLPACLAHMLYYVVAEEQYNLAYFFVKRIECARATPTANLPYGMFLTRLYRHVMETYPHLDNSIYDIVE
ncbi:pentatricopeptide repeat-containing protein [Tanacetum coccineum]